MRALLATLLLLTACNRSEPSRAAEQSACRSELFEEVRFTVCDAERGKIELVAAGPGEPAIRRLADLELKLGPKASRVAFAMNAGMYDEDGRPIGLAIVKGKQKHAVNRREGGGNFHLMPNGVFQVHQDGRAEIVPTTAWKPSKSARIATQSGPMLVINGKLHPTFEPDGMSKYVRNGVGITPNGRPVFVISDAPVSFGKFARLFRDRIKARNALFFDGSVSALWDPAVGRRDVTKPLGPLIVVFKPVA